MRLATAQSPPDLSCRKAGSYKILQGGQLGRSEFLDLVLRLRGADGAAPRRGLADRMSSPNARSSSELAATVTTQRSTFGSSHSGVKLPWPSIWSSSASSISRCTTPACRASRMASPYSPECPVGLPLWAGRQRLTTRASDSLRLGAAIVDPTSNLSAIWLVVVPIGIN